MNHLFKISAFLLVLLSCEQENDIACSVKSAISGYTNGVDVTYYYDYVYTYTGNVLTKVEFLDIDTKAKILVTDLEYDAHGRISVLRTSEGSHTYYEYGTRSIKSTIYNIVRNDTISVVVNQDFYIEKPTNKVYRDPNSNNTYKFQDGNVIEYGVYEVNGTDTTDIFTERYTYDDKPNYYNSPEYRVSIPSEFLWAKVTSDNNLVRAQYIAGTGWDFHYTFDYDSHNNLTRHIGKSGILVEFDYLCQ